MGKPYIVCSVPNVGQCEILDSRVDGGENEPLIVARFWNHQLANRAAELLNAEVDQPPALTIAAEASALHSDLLILNCGDDQPIGVVSLNFQALNGAAGRMLEALQMVRECLASMRIESDHYRMSIDDLALIGQVVKKAIAEAQS